MDAVNEFRNELELNGLRPREVVPDGVLRRCPTSDKPRDNAGWYVLYDGPPVAGAFGDWRTGLNQTWCAGGNDGGMDVETQRRIQERIEEEKKARKEEEALKHLKAAEEARQIIKSLPSAMVENPSVVVGTLGDTKKTVIYLIFVSNPGGLS